MDPSQQQPPVVTVPRRKITAKRYWPDGAVCAARSLPGIAPPSTRRSQRPPRCRLGSATVPTTPSRKHRRARPQPRPPSSSGSPAGGRVTSLGSRSALAGSSSSRAEDQGSLRPVPHLDPRRTRAPRTRRPPHAARRLRPSDRDRQTCSRRRRQRRPPAVGRPSTHDVERRRMCHKCAMATPVGPRPVRPIDGRTSATQAFSGWRCGESNPGPQQCDCCALPTELHPRGATHDSGRGDRTAGVRRRRSRRSGALSASPRCAAAWPASTRTARGGPGRRRTPSWRRPCRGRTRRCRSRPPRSPR